jgi:hypothetical protein
MHGYLPLRDGCVELHRSKPVTPTAPRRVRESADDRAWDAKDDVEDEALAPRAKLLWAGPHLS